jgi:hypothetical protein
MGPCRTTLSAQEEVGVELVGLDREIARDLALLVEFPVYQWFIAWRRVHVLLLSSVQGDLLSSRSSWVERL